MQNLDDMDVAFLVRNCSEDPKFARNIRGRTAAALRLLDEKSQKLLACDYVENLIWMCKEATREGCQVRETVTAARMFCRSQVTIEDVSKVHYDLYSTLFRFNQLQQLPEARPAIDVLKAASLVLAVCCQRELEETGRVARTRYHPSVVDVASAASYAAARYAAGIDWSSTDPGLKHAAKARGRVASEAESTWQLDHLLEYIGLELTPS